MFVNDFFIGNKVGDSLKSSKKKRILFFLEIKIPHSQNNQLLIYFSQNMTILKKISFPTLSEFCEI